MSYRSPYPDITVPNVTLTELVLAKAGEKPEFAHTLNASGVALPRTIAALLETHQQADGSVVLPKSLAPYFGADRIAAPAAGGP